MVEGNKQMPWEVLLEAQQNKKRFEVSMIRICHGFLVGGDDNSLKSEDISLFAFCLRSTFLPLVSGGIKPCTSPK